MKPFNGIPDYRQKSEKKVEEATLTFKPCCICHKEITAGCYGNWHDGGTCSKTCEATRQDMQLYLAKE